MTDIPTIEPNCLESDREQLKATLAKITAGCPCDDCKQAKTCMIECKPFRRWVANGAG